MIHLIQSHSRWIGYLCALCLTLGTLGQAFAIEKIEADQRAVKLINRFMQTLQMKDHTARDTTVVKLLHKSMLNKNGEMTPSLKNYSFKKACDGVKFYQVPVKITEVHKGRVLTIGFRETAERGRVDKYFVAKRKGIAGLPAPLHVFWPEGGGQPTLVNIGSL